VIHAAIDVNGEHLVHVEIVRQLADDRSWDDHAQQTYHARAHQVVDFTPRMREVAIRHTPIDGVWELLAAAANALATP